jgi:hypothetical protein
MNGLSQLIFLIMVVVALYAVYRAGMASNDGEHRALWICVCIFAAVVAVFVWNPVWVPWQ